MEHSQIKKARAIIATYPDEEFTTSDLIEYSRECGFTLNRKAFNNNITAYRLYFFIENNRSKNGNNKKYKIKPEFWNRFIFEKNDYCEILPGKKDLIESRFSHIKQSDANEVIKEDKPVDTKIRYYKPYLIYYAILTAFNGPHSAPQVVETANRYGYPLRLDTLRYFMRINEGRFTKLVSRSGGVTFYEMTNDFYETQKIEKHYNTSIALLPDKREAIMKRLKLNENDIEHVDLNALKTKKIENPEKHQNISPKIIYCAILTAYNKPLSAYDIVTIAEKRGYKLNVATIGIFFRKHTELVKYEGKGTFGRMCYTIKPEFLYKHKHKMDKFIEILPYKKDAIIERFKLIEPKPEVETIEPELNEFIEPAENETGDIHSAESAHDFEEKDIENYIDAANVGRAILSYIEKLKGAKPQSVKDHDALQAKYSDAQQTIINQKNEINGLNYQIDKLKRMVEDNNDKLIKLTHELSRFKNEKMTENKPENGKFKMSEVARIATLIKSPRSQVPR